MPNTQMQHQLDTLNNLLTNINPYLTAKSQVVKHFARMLPNLDQFICKIITFLSCQTISITIRKQSAAILNLILKQTLHQKQLKEVAQLLFMISTSCMIPYQVKQLLHNSVEIGLLTFAQQLSGFMEDVMVVMANMIAQIDQQQNKEHSFSSQEIECKHTDCKFVITLEMPKDAVASCECLTFILSCLVDNLQKQQQHIPYYHCLAETIRKIQQISFRVQNLIPYRSVNKSIMRIWESITNILKDYSPSVLQFYRQASQWEQLPELLSCVYALDTQTIQFEQSGQVLVGNNYLLIKDNWQNNELTLLKKSFFDLHINMLTILQAYDLQGNLLSSSLNSIIYNVIVSLKTFANNYTQMTEDLIMIGEQCLSLLGSYISINAVNVEWLITITQQIILPILQVQIRNRQKLFNEDPQQLCCQLQDCCQDHMSASVISIICMLLQLMSSKHDEYYPLVFDLLCCNQSELPCYNQSDIMCCNQSDLNTARKGSSTQLKVDVKVFLLVITVINCYQKEQTQQFNNRIKLIISQQLFACLSDYDRAYVYLCMAYSWTYLYQHQQTMFFPATAINHNQTDALLHFGFNFFLSLITDRFIQPLASMFLQQFTVYPKVGLKWEILSKIISNNISELDPNQVANIVNWLRVQIKLIHDKRNNSIKNIKVQDNDQLHQFINICRDISKETAYIQQNKVVESQLMQVIINIDHIDGSYLDDIVMWIANDLLQAKQQMTPQFQKYITTVRKYYQNCQYNGIAYISLIGTYIKMCRQNLQLIADIYEIINSAFIYFAHFPRNDESAGCPYDINQSINNNLVLLITHFITNGNLLPSQTVYQMLMQINQNNTQNCRFNILKYINNREDNYIQARLTLLELICRTLLVNCGEIHQMPLTGQQQLFPINRILLQVEQHVFLKIDALMLLNLMSPVYNMIDKLEQKANAIRIVYQLLLTEQWRTSQLKNSQQRLAVDLMQKKYNQIFTILEMPFNCQNTLRKEAKQLIATISQHPQYQSSLQLLLPQQFQALFSILSQIEQNSFVTSFKQLAIQYPQHFMKDRRIVKVLGAKSIYQQQLPQKQNKRYLYHQDQQYTSRDRKKLRKRQYLEAKTQKGQKIMAKRYSQHEIRI